MIAKGRSFRVLLCFWPQDSCFDEHEHSRTNVRPCSRVHGEQSTKALDLVRLPGYQVDQG